MVGLHGALVMSDGVSCAVTEYRTTTWPDMWDLATTRGPAAVLAAVHAVELGDPDGERWARSKRHDDKILAIVEIHL